MASTYTGTPYHADLAQATFGQFIWLTDVPTSGNSPHHLGSSKDGKTLVGGGLLSLLKLQVWHRTCAYDYSR